MLVVKRRDSYLASIEERNFYQGKFFVFLLALHWVFKLVFRWCMTSLCFWTQTEQEKLDKGQRRHKTLRLIRYYSAVIITPCSGTMPWLVNIFATISFSYNSDNFSTCFNNTTAFKLFVYNKSKCLSSRLPLCWPDSRALIYILHFLD